MYSMWQFETLYFSESQFSYRSIEMIMCHFVFKCKFKYENLDQM